MRHAFFNHTVHLILIKIQAVVDRYIFIQGLTQNLVLTTIWWFLNLHRRSKSRRILNHQGFQQGFHQRYKLYRHWWLHDDMLELIANHLICSILSRCNMLLWFVTVTSDDKCALASSDCCNLQNRWRWKKLACSKNLPMIWIIGKTYLLSYG